MSKYRIEDYLALCALTYFDIEEYQKGMRIVDFIQECLMKTDNLSVFFKNTLEYLFKQGYKKVRIDAVVDNIGSNVSSISYAITLLAFFTNFLVSAPAPGPISITNVSSSILADDTILLSIFSSVKKF